jgi:hypothetical protein
MTEVKILMLKTLVTLIMRVLSWSQNKSYNSKFYSNLDFHSLLKEGTIIDLRLTFTNKKEGNV